MLRAVVSVLLLVAFGSAVTGAPEKAGPHPLSALPKPGQITVGHFFPEYANKKFPAGVPIKVVLGIHNDASEVYNITAILGSINSVSDFKMYIQNFTNQVYMQNLEPGKELSVEYTFQTYPQLPARDFIVALTLFYSKPSGEYMSTTFFNSTVDIVEKKKYVDFDLIMMYMILLAMAAGLVWVFVPSLFSYFQQKKGNKKGGSKSYAKPLAPTSEEKAAEDDEWIRGTPYDAFRRRKSATQERSDSITKKTAAKVK